MVYIQSATAEIRRGKKKIEKRRRNQRTKYNVFALFHRTTIKNEVFRKNGPVRKPVESVLRPEESSGKDLRKRYLESGLKERELWTVRVVS